MALAYWTVCERKSWNIERTDRWRRSSRHYRRLRAANLRWSVVGRVENPIQTRWWPTWSRWAVYSVPKLSSRPFFSSRPHDCPSHIHSSRHLVNYNVERFEQLINEDLALYKIHYYFYYLSTILHSEIMVQAIFLISSRPTHEFHDSSFQFHSSRRLVDSTKSGNIR